MGGLSCLLKKSLSASSMHACIVVSSSAARIRNCFRAATGTQNGKGVLPSLSGRAASGVLLAFSAAFGGVPRTAAARLPLLLLGLAMPVWWLDLMAESRVGRNVCVSRKKL